MRLDRIVTDFHVSATVAADTLPLLAERIERLIGYGRRIAMTRRYTYTDDAPDLYAGLLVERVRRSVSDFYVSLRPGILGFGFGAEVETEEAAWARYRAGLPSNPDFLKRRRNVTCVEIAGNPLSAARHDRILIQAWNDDGVCDERVIAFDNTREGS